MVIVPQFFQPCLLSLICSEYDATGEQSWEVAFTWGVPELQVSRFPTPARSSICSHVDANDVYLQEEENSLPGRKAILFKLRPSKSALSLYVGPEGIAGWTIGK